MKYIIYNVEQFQFPDEITDAEMLIEISYPFTGHDPLQHWNDILSKFWGLPIQESLTDVARVLKQKGHLTTLNRGQY